MAKLIEKNSTVSELYEKKTGKKWNTAKAEGLTSGSYEDNIKLKHRLLSGEFDLDKNKLIETAKKVSNIKSSYDSGPVEENIDQYLIPPKNKEYNELSFNDAFIKARKELGAGKTFTYNGKVYSTNYKEEEVSDNNVSNQNNKSNKLISKTNKDADKSNNKSNVQNKSNNKSTDQNNKSTDQNKSPQFQNKLNKIVDKKYEQKTNINPIGKYDWQTEIRPNENTIKDLQYLSSLQNENEINAYIQNKKLIQNQNNRYDEDGNLIYDENGMRYRASGAAEITSNPLELLLLGPSGAGSKVAWKIIEKQVAKQSSKLLPKATQKMLPIVTQKMLPSATPKLLPQAQKLLLLNP